MQNSTEKKTLIPIIVILAICFLWFGPLSIPYFGTILAAIVVIIASYVEYKGKLFSSLGFQRKDFSIKNILFLAPLMASVLFLIYLFILVPGIASLTGKPLDYSEFESFEGNLPACLIGLVFIWASAGFGEEIIFRGYFMQQFVKFFGDGKLSIIINIIVFGCFFGYVHAYQGISGQLITGIIGAMLATIFYLRKYNLWLLVAIHGFFDTIALICVYFGLL